LKETAIQVRLNIIEMITEVRAEHPGGSLSAADIATALYFRLMRIDPVNPQWEGRDRLILSKGHAWPVWYTALAERSYSQNKPCAGAFLPWSNRAGHSDKRPGRVGWACIPNKATRLLVHSRQMPQRSPSQNMVPIPG
jgi:transketolase